MKSHILAAAVGAVAGGIIVERVTKAVPKMMAKMSEH
jgi:outer membrane lipoprotein SlyB